MKQVDAIYLEAIGGTLKQVSSLNRTPAKVTRQVACTNFGVKPGLVRVMLAKILIMIGYTVFLFKKWFRLRA